LSRSDAFNGDYLDTRIRNTASELATYEPELDRLLDRVLDEFGLIVCGWSGEWDAALRAAIDRTPSRRFPMYWAARGALARTAQAIVARRGARVVQVESADTFFDQVAERVEAIERLRRPHPLSTEMAVAQLKEYLPEPRSAIRLHDLLSVEFSRAMDRLSDPALDATAGPLLQVFSDQVERYRVAFEPLLPLAYVAGRWGSAEQAEQWLTFLQSIVRRRRGIGGTTVFVDLRAFPATLVLYAFGIGAVIGRRPESLGRLLSAVVDFGHCGQMALGDGLNVFTLVTDGGDGRFRLLKQYESRRAAGSDLVADIVRPLAMSETRDEEAFELAFARLELALTFGFVERRVRDDDQEFWAPAGRCVFNAAVRETVLRAWRADYDERGNESEIARLAGLKLSPRFDDVERLLRRAGRLM